MKKISLAIALLIGFSTAAEDATAATGNTLGYSYGTPGYYGNTPGYYGNTGNYGAYYAPYTYGYGKGSGNKGTAPHNKGEVNYDYSCKAENLEKQLQNEITIYGVNAILVNLDNRVQIEQLEREGIFLQTGDILFVTGRENSCNLQEWEEPRYNNPLDYDVLFPGLDYDMPLISEKGKKQEIVALEAVGSGQTTYEISLWWGREIVRDVKLEIYVDEQPSLTVAHPRFSC